MLQIVIKVGRKEYAIWGVRSWNMSIDGKAVVIYTKNTIYFADRGKVISGFVSNLDFEVNDPEIMDILHH